MKAYIDIGKKILKEGVWIKNARTGQKTLTIIGVTFEHNLADGTMPAVTTKKLFWKKVIMNILRVLKMN